MNSGSFLGTLNAKLEPPVRIHLKNVYSCVAISTLAAALGGYVHLFTGLLEAGILSAVASLGFLIALIATPDDGKNRTSRLGYLTAFAFLSGLGLGPLLKVLIEINPSIIPTAFLSTCLVFACFTFSALFSDHRRYLYLGGTLMSLLSALVLMSLVNLYIGSYPFFKFHLYLGLAIMCGFIMYDTQAIIEKRRSGDTDYIWHSLDLFLDLIKIFRHIAILLADKEKSKKNKN